MSRFCKIGLALGGGGARGLAHLGVLRELEKAKIPIDLLTGTSMGALVAAVYAQNPTSSAAINRFRNFLESPEFKKTNPEFLRSHNHEETPLWEGVFQRLTSFIRKSIFYGQSLTRQASISEEKFTENINFLLEEGQIEDAAKPLSVIALDLKSCGEVILRKGPIRRAVSASCAIPGIFPPVEIEDRELVDGGWVDRVPVHPAKIMGADFIIAVDVGEGIEKEEDFSTGLGVYLRTCDVSRVALTRLQLKEADAIVCPDVSGVHWSDFGHLDECVRAGEEAIAAQLDEIKNKISRKKVRNFLLYPFSGKRNLQTAEDETCPNLSC
jgi:NTE family protein